MKVAPETIALKNDLSSVNKRLENLRKSRLKEEEEVKKRWQAQIDDVNKDGDERLYQTQLRGQDNTSKEILAQEEKLKGVRDSYTEQMSKINSEKEMLSERFESERKNNAIVQAERISELQSNVGDQGSTIGESLGQKLKQINNDKNRAIKDANAIVRRTMASKYNSNEKVLNDEDLRFKDMKNKMFRDNSAQLFMEKIEHEKELGRVKSEGMSKKEQQKQIYDKELTNTRIQHEEILKSEVKSFQQKLDSIKELHDIALMHVKQKNGAELQSLLEDQSRIKDAKSARADDPFYSPSLLNPTVEDKIKFYEIKLAVPDFEEKSVVLSGNKRDLKIIHGRRSEMNVELPDGSYNKSNRNETFVKEFSVADIIDPSKITRNYANGLLTFRIDKL